MKAFKRSQAAHRRLVRLHADKAARAKAGTPQCDIHFIRCNYHSSVYSKQEKLGRKLSADEKKRAYSDVIKTFY